MEVNFDKIVVVGVDPGLGYWSKRRKKDGSYAKRRIKEGGMAIIFGNIEDKAIAVNAMPETSKMAVEALRDDLSNVPEDYTIVIAVEAQGSMGVEGRASLVKLMGHYGFIVGGFAFMPLKARKIVTLIRPRDWYNRLGLKKIKKGDKPSARYCVEKYGKEIVTLKKAPHPGVTDALCIAEAAYRDIELNGLPEDNS